MPGTTRAGLLLLPLPPPLFPPPPHPRRGHLCSPRLIGLIRHYRAPGHGAALVEGKGGGRGEGRLGKARKVGTAARRDLRDRRDRFEGIREVFDFGTN